MADVTTELEMFKGSPTFLVADDEDLMREVVSIMIEEHGGEVIEASDGTQAVEKFKTYSDRVSCVFLDFSMPGLNGYEVYQAIREVNRTVPVVMMSGLKITPEVEILWRNKEIEFISKPFHEEALITLLQRQLNGAPAA